MFKFTKSKTGLGPKMDFKAIVILYHFRKIADGTMRPSTRPIKTEAETEKVQKNVKAYGMYEC